MLIGMNALWINYISVNLKANLLKNKVVKLLEL